MLFAFKRLGLNIYYMRLLRFARNDSSIGPHHDNFIGPRHDTFNNDIFNYDDNDK